MTTWNPLARDLPALAPQHVRLSADLFAPEVPCTAIDRTLANVALYPKHTFSVFTEHPERMAEYFNDPYLWSDIQGQVDDAELWDNSPIPEDCPAPIIGDLPLPNLALGVLIHTQAEADARLAVLLQTPAAVRGVRVVPREAVTLRRWLGMACCRPEWSDDLLHAHDCANSPQRGLDWITVAGEADPVHPQHVRDLCREAEAAGVPFVFEGWGEWGPCGYPLPDQQEHATEFTLVPLDEPWDGRCSDDGEATRHLYGNECMAAMARVGAERSGRVLDGAVYEALPEAWTR